MGRIENLLTAVVLVSLVIWNEQKCIAQVSSEAIKSGEVQVVVVREGEDILGFDILAGGRLIAPMKLSSNRLVVAKKVETRRADKVEQMKLTDLQAKWDTGVTFGPEDFVLVKLLSDDPYPQIEFRLSLLTFEIEAWKSGAGNFPFHFLIFSMPEAEVWHQRGWVMATPKSDPFPLLIDPHVGSPEIASKWSRNWSYACPLGAHPIPVIGLWAPKEKLYVGYDFQEARVTDHSEKYIATAYCWKEGADSQFVTLVYPYGGKLYQTLMFPEPGTTIASHFRLIYSTDLDSTKDPNQFWQDLLFSRYGHLLPRVPKMNDMSWMPGGVRLANFYTPPSPRLVYSVGEKGGVFEAPGTIQVGGWGWHRESPVEVAYQKILQEKEVKTKEKYISFFNVVDGQGHSYGDAGAYMELAAGEAKGGKILYIWHGLLADSRYGQSILEQTFGFILREAKLDKEPEARRWKRVAILPPDLSGVTVEFLGKLGVLSQMVRLSPEQLIDKKVFNPKKFPVAFDLGEESYFKTVKKSGDARKALIDYLKNGGFLVLLGKGPYPMHYAMEPGLRKSEPLLPQLGVPMEVCFEEPPPDLVVLTNKDQETVNLAALPEKFEFPKTGDLRLRAIATYANALEGLKKDLEYLLPRAKRMTIEGEECIFWEKPIEGKWWDNWGGDGVKTLHNTNGWAVAMALVDLYRHERDPKYLIYIDGAYNWTKHFVWTRNEFNDVPSSPFAIGGTLSTAFLLDYYFTFKHDPERVERAKAALELAKSILWRYMPVWTTDNDEEDILDPCFLMEPNSGRDWAGLACANEVHWVLDSMTQVYVHTGDRRLNYYLRGALQRWYQLYKDRYAPSVLDYPGDALSEGLGFFDGSGPGRGGRYDFGGADVLPLHYPVGNSLVRVICGEKAAFACNKNGVHTQIAEYRYQAGEKPSELGADVNFSFRLMSRLSVPFDVSVTFPFVNISKKPVQILREGKRITLPPERDLIYPVQSPSSIYLRNLQNGDVVIVGTVDLRRPELPTENGFEYATLETEDMKESKFEMLLLPYDREVSFNWDDNSSFAGLVPGKHYAYKVPYFLASPEITGGPICIQKEASLKAPIANATHLFVVYAEAGEEPSIEFALETGERLKASLGEAVLAWKAWPPIFQWRLWLVSLPIPAGRKIISVVPRNAMIFALTVWRGSEEELSTVMACLQRAIEESQRTRREEAKIAELRKQLAGAEWGKVAILPPDVQGPAAAWAGKMGLTQKMVSLSADKLIDASFFNPQRFPVALNLGSERYLKTVKSPGDAREVLVNYLKNGGLIVCLISQPFPFYYALEAGEQKAEPLLPQLGVPISITFEQPPVELFMVPNGEQTVLNLRELPAKFPFPREGDLRLRAIDSLKVLEGTKYTALFSVVDAEGNSYGDAGAYIELVSGEAAGGRILYLWHTLLAHPEYGPQILEQVFRFIAQQVKK